MARAKPLTVRLLIAATLLQGISGLGGGVGLILDPTGASLAIPLEWLDGSPFTSYLIPGLILFSVLGIFPLVTAYGLQKERPWSWIASLGIGVALMIWILVEVMIIGYQTEPPLQLIYALLGMFIIILALIPSSSRYLQSDHVA